MDWADKQAREFLDGLEYDDLDWINGPGAPWQRLAAALRKAKADGMREGAQIVLTATDQQERGQFVNAQDGYAVALSRANAIEKGTE